MASPQELADAIVHRFLTLLRYQRHFSYRLRGDLGITGRQLGALRYVVEQGPCTVRQISRYLYIRDATASPLLERLERAGYVTRRRCSRDSRRVLVEATDAGRQIVAQAPLGALAQLRRDLPTLPPEELQRIDAALTRLCQVAGVDESMLE